MFFFCFFFSLFFFLSFFCQKSFLLSSPLDGVCLEEFVRCFKVLLLKKSKKSGENFHVVSVVCCLRPSILNPMPALAFAVIAENSMHFIFVVCCSRPSILNPMSALIFALVAVNFKLQHAKDHDGGQNQPVKPTGSWIDMYLNTSFTVPETPSEADTVTIWVKARDILGTEVVERTQVTFDGSPPSVQSLKFHMNVPVEGIDFSSS